MRIKEQYSMAIDVAIHTASGGQPSTTDENNVLDPGGVRRLQRGFRTLHVISGLAWITSNGKDFLLESGDELMLERGTHDNLLSALGEHPLVYEMK
jgi:hypothetical protein